jgi:hypothetical protein
VGSVTVWYATVKEPDVHHNHWGLELHRENDQKTHRVLMGIYGVKIEAVLEIESCSEFTNQILRLTKDLGVFHQGGSHNWDQYCGGWHYFEFWRMPGDEDLRPKVIQIIKQLEENP